LNERVARTAVNSAGFARSVQLSAQISLSRDLKNSFILCACIFRAITLMAKLWRKAQSIMPGKLVDFFSPYEETQASEYSTENRGVRGTKIRGDACRRIHFRNGQGGLLLAHAPGV
jgi:hypothetical protein